MSIIHYNGLGFSITNDPGPCDSAAEGPAYQAKCDRLFPYTAIAHRDILEQWLCLDCFDEQYPDLAAHIGQGNEPI